MGNKTVADIFSEQTLGIMQDDTRAELQIIKDATNRKVAETVGLLESIIREMCETAPHRIFAHVHPESGEELRIVLGDEGNLIAEYKNDGRRIDGPPVRPVHQIGPIADPPVSGYVLRYFDSVLAPQFHYHQDVMFDALGKFHKWTEEHLAPGSTAEDPAPEPAQAEPPYDPENLDRIDAILKEAHEEDT